MWRSPNAPFGTFWVVWIFREAESSAVKNVPRLVARLAHRGPMVIAVMLLVTNIVQRLPCCLAKAS